MQGQTSALIRCPMDFRATSGPSLAAGRRPIFLHGMWRSGSTYVWSRFRTSGETLCFYEPLHGGMGRLTRARLERETPEVGRELRHPPLAHPYFAEYAPRLGRRGVRMFREGFARDRFVLGAQDRHPRLQAYLESLLALAGPEGRTAVLGFNRANLRMPWLARFGAFNLYVERDPQEIWASYADHAAHGNFSFLKNWLLILERNRRDPLLAPLAERSPLRRTLAERLRKPKPHYAEAIARMLPQDTYLLVHYLWLVSLIQAVAHCEVVLDVSAARRDGTIAAKAAAAVRSATGVGRRSRRMRRAAAAAATGGGLA